MSSNISSKLENQSLHEEKIKSKISNIISMVADKKNYNLSVNVELNYNKINQTNNDFITPDKEVILKKSSVPSGKNSSRQNIEYGYGTKSESIEYSIGEIKRITAGIIITKAMNKPAIENLEKVIADAIGLNKDRGDSISIVVMDSQTANLDIAAADTSQNIAATNLGENSAEAPTESNETIVEKPVEQLNSSSPVTNEVAVVEANYLSHPLLKQNYLLIALAVMTFLFLFNILFSRSRRLSGNQREKLLNDVQNWLKE